MLIAITAELSSVMQSTIVPSNEVHNWYIRSGARRCEHVCHAMAMPFCSVALHCRDEFVGYSVCTLPNTPGCHHVSCPVWAAVQSNRSFSQEITSKQTDSAWPAWCIL